MADTRDLLVRIKGDTKDFESAMNNVTKQSGSAGLSFGKMAGAVATGQAVFQLAERGARFLTGALGDTIQAFSDSQNQASQLDAVLASTASAAGVTRDAAIDLSKSFESVTAYSDEQVLSVENMALTFTSIGKDIFPDATKAALDMAVALNHGVTPTADEATQRMIMVGKALQDPIGGLTALKKAGVNVNDTFKEHIKTLVDMGKTQQAQKEILGELNREFGGSAANAAHTYAGAMKSLKEKVNDVQESIGGAIVNAITPFAIKLAEFTQTDKFKKWVQDVTNWLNDNLPKALNWLKDTGFPLLKQIIDDTWPIIKKMYDAFSDFVNFANDHKWVVEALVGLFVALKTAMFLNGALEAFKGVMGGVTAAYQATSAGIAAAPIVMPAIAVGAALGAIALVYNKYKETMAVIEDNEAKIKTSVDSTKGAYDSLIQMTRSPYPADVQARAKHNLHNLGVAGYATGGDVNAGEPIVVGERGQEVFVPKSDGSIVPNHKLNSGSPSGGNVNITVNMGMYAGMPIEKRQIAMDLYKELLRAGRAQGVNSLPLIGSIGIQ